MTGMKYRHCSKKCETTCKITNYFSTCKVWQGIACYIVLYNTLHNTNNFLIAKAEAMLLLIKLISEKKSPYTDASNRKDPTSIDEEILDRSEVTKMLEVKYITPKSEYITSTQSKSGIQSIQNRLKSIKFDNCIREQIVELVDKKNTTVYIVDIPINQDNICFLFKNNVEYIQAKFMQVSKISKGSINIFFNNSDLASIQQYLSYKNIDKIRVLLTKLSYSKVTWQTKSISICSVITNMAPKEYFMYYLNIIPTICFLINYHLFASYMAYVLI